MNGDKFDPLHVLLSAFSVSSFAGLAALLRSNNTITWRSILSAMLYSGMMGLAIALIWLNYGYDSTYFMLGVCALAGLGGTSLLEFILLVVRRGGVKITIDPDD